MVALLAGLADPPKAGHSSLSLTWSASPRNARLIVPHAAAPYTVEVSFTLPMERPTVEAWRLEALDADAGTYLAIQVYDDGTYSFTIPGDRRSLLRVEFIHLRRRGQPNQMRLDVDRAQRLTLRFNDEIAWSGTLPTLDQSGQFGVAYVGDPGASEGLPIRIEYFAP